MFARMLEFNIKAEKKNESVKLVQADVLPILKKQTGFLEILPFFGEIVSDTVVTSHGGISRCLQVAMLGLQPIDAINMLIPQDRIMIMRGKTLAWA